MGSNVLIEKKYVWGWYFDCILDVNGGQSVKKLYICSQRKRSRTYMVRRIILILLAVLSHSLTNAITRHWTVADGLPTGEIRQIIELPNGQMLVNCEGAFCLSDGKTFITLPCKRNKAFRLEHYVRGYAHLWQGDSLLWLRDFYHVFIFDTHSRSFRYDFGQLSADTAIQRFIAGETGNDTQNDGGWGVAASHGLTSQATCVTTDRQGGTWIGTGTDGIYYIAPTRHIATVVCNDSLLRLTTQTTDSKGRKWQCTHNGLVCLDGSHQSVYHNGNVKGLTHVQMNFITELPDHRFLLCYTIHQLGYFNPEKRTFTSLNAQLPELSHYRYFVGACPIDSQWTAVYTQNGAFLLDTATDTLADFPCKEAIETYSDKYNCMIRDKRGNLWVGTQDGLFCLSPSRHEAKPATGHRLGYTCKRIEGMTNNCIRSLVADASGNIWAGTSCGVSRITPLVTNLWTDDGVSPVSMTERAVCLTTDHHLAFAHDKEVILFHPDSIIQAGTPASVVLTALEVNDIPIVPGTKPSDRLLFNYHQNHIRFQLSALNYATPFHTLYSYRLLGTDTIWHQSDESHDGAMCTVEYRSLPPGDYVFEAQSTIFNGQWGTPFKVSFTIAPPLWLTWWAKLLYIIIIVFTLLFIIRLYLKRHRRKMERENDERVNRLFELRDQARHQFAESTHIDPRKISVGSEEERLTEQMLRAIETHINDTAYGANQLAADVCMSRSALYSKLRVMLGITPSEFIRSVRLKHAAELLSDTQLPINEIAERTGYGTHKAFAANFKKMFGVLPSEYRSLTGGQKPPSP